MIPRIISQSSAVAKPSSLPKRIVKPNVSKAPRVAKKTSIAIASVSAPAAVTRPSINLGIQQYRSYSSNPKKDLIYDVRQFIKESEQDFDQAALNTLLDNNGWKLVMDDKTIFLNQSFGDTKVTVEILTDSEPVTENAMDEARESMSAEHSHDHDHHHHDGDEESAAGLLTNQNDMFNVMIEHGSASELGTLIFQCAAKEGTLVIMSVNLTDASKDLENGKGLAFGELSEQLQSSFENYLLAHGINHDLAEIIYHSLHLYDLNYDRDWAAKTIKFLEH